MSAQTHPVVVRSFREIVGEFRDGDLVCFSGTSWISRAIQYFTGSAFSHAALFMWLDVPGQGKVPCVLESVFSGVRVFPLEQALLEYKDLGGKTFWQRRLTEFPGGELSIIEGVKLWGKGYPPFKQLAILSTDWTRRLWSWFIGDLDLDSSGYHCSEFVAVALSYSGVQLPKPAVEMTPEDISLLPIWCGRVELYLEAPIS